MEINRFKELMNEEGLEVEEKIANKYGYDEMSFVIGSGNTRPTVYESNIVKMNEEQVKDMIVNQIKNGVPDFDPDELTDKDYILRNVTMAIRHSTTDNSILKLKIRGDLEVYFRVKVEVNSNNGDIGSYKLTDEIINKAGLTKQEIYYKAEENTSKESEIISMNEMLKERTLDKYYITIVTGKIDRFSELKGYKKCQAWIFLKKKVCRECMLQQINQE